MHAARKPRIEEKAFGNGPTQLWRIPYSIAIKSLHVCGNLLTICLYKICILRAVNDKQFTSFYNLRATQNGIKHNDPLAPSLCRRIPQRNCRLYASCLSSVEVVIHLCLPVDVYLLLCHVVAQEYLSHYTLASYRPRLMPVRAPFNHASLTRKQTRLSVVTVAHYQRHNWAGRRSDRRTTVPLLSEQVRVFGREAAVQLCG